MSPPSAASPTQENKAAGGTAARLAAWFRSEGADWFNSEGQRWVFVAKAMLAAFSALWLAFRLGLDSPSTALATTVILALPSSGMVLEKAFYRFLGTIVGCAASLLLVALFPQSPPVLFIGVALWVALCTGGAAMHRNQQSYSFVLAGYTACMIAIPAIDAPGQVFTLAVTRMTEVGLGIICAAVVHDVIFPRRHSRAVMRTVQTRYAGFLAFCQQVLERRLSPAEAELNHLKFAADIAALESGRAAAFFEADHARSHTRQLHAFNAAFMTVLTTFYTLHRLSHRLRANGTGPVLALVEPMHAHLAQAMKLDPTAGQLAR
ncbi:MAG TPA: FUSC family protein, partial [Duganella sp.]|nr:FUSC family protein [Duganella sp.]